eukprot:TRINITY_DN2850_c0_g1_i2.p1 TRINITY_DN2850_c0_g1~~TRINITY_DN2850_c0_g1_i2.p1  ORF type:complete len:214 (+),score=75.09 TRINITY_DN2850_c0_g1_i2:309-950(+)
MELDLSYNELKELPRTMNYFVNLRNLILSNNRLGAGPASDDNVFYLGTMPKLQVLNLNANSLQTLPELVIDDEDDGGEDDDMVKQLFPNLLVLTIADNKIEVEEEMLPLADLPAITHLIVWGNPVLIRKRSKNLPLLVDAFGDKQVYIALSAEVFSEEKPQLAFTMDDLVRVEEDIEILHKKGLYKHRYQSYDLFPAMRNNFSESSTHPCFLL